jgi:hypothetical protein
MESFLMFYLVVVVVYSSSTGVFLWGFFPLWNVNAFL